MNEREVLEILKKNLAELESKLKNSLDIQNNLVNAIAEAKNSNDASKANELERGIFPVNVKIDQFGIKISRLKDRISKLESGAKEEGQENVVLEQELKELLEKKIEETKKQEEYKEDAAEEKLLEQELEDLDEEYIQKGQKNEEESKSKQQERTESESFDAEKTDEEGETSEEKTVGEKESSELPVKAIKSDLSEQKDTKKISKTYLDDEKKDERKNKVKKVFGYLLPLGILLLVLSVFYFSGPGITGNIVLEEKKTYQDNLNLTVNQTGNYTWGINQTGYIESIKATGRVEGNGTVKIYIEKDGQRYLIFDNKK